MNRNINPISKKLVLGTAQIGSNYGITNKKKITYQESREIFDFCEKNNFIKLDTAINYKDSEKIIGSLINKKWKINTKLPKYNFKKNIGQNVNQWVRNLTFDSLSRLNIKSLNCMYIHDSNSILNIHGEKIYNALIELKEEKIIDNIGISVYSPKELDEVLKQFNFDYVQIPINILDQRFLKDDYLAKLSSKNIFIQARSVFLQGLLLLTKKKLEKMFDNSDQIWSIWHEWIMDNNLDQLEACLSFVFHLVEVNEIIIGVGSFDNLKEIINSVNKEIPRFPIELINQDSPFLDPRNWS